MEISICRGWRGVWGGHKMCYKPFIVNMQRKLYFVGGGGANSPVYFSVKT